VEEMMALGRDGFGASPRDMGYVIQKIVLNTNTTTTTTTTGPSLRSMRVTL